MERVVPTQQGHLVRLQIRSMCYRRPELLLLQPEGMAWRQRITEKSTRSDGKPANKGMPPRGNLVLVGQGLSPGGTELTPRRRHSTPLGQELTPGGRGAVWYARIALLIACVYFAQLYTSLKPPYLNLRAYALGLERMPFQTRELMRYPLLLAGQSALLRRLTAGKSAVNTPELLVLDVSNCVCLALAGWAAVKLYRVYAPRSRMPWSPFALLIVICLFDFYLTVPFSFPYDLPATMFLGWGTYFVATRQFGSLLPVFVLGTWNRETTLFLILLMISMALTRAGQLTWRSLTRRDMLQIALLSALWLAITVGLHHRYASNLTEAGSRTASNLRALGHPLLWPNILSASAFLLPWIWLKRDRLPQPLQAGALLLPFWVLLLLCVGQILELRIYGDISVLVAVCAAWLIAGDTDHEPGQAIA